METFKMQTRIAASTAWIALLLSCSHPSPANAVDPAIVPLQDSRIMYFQTVTSTTAFAGMDTVPVLKPDGTVERRRIAPYDSNGTAIRNALALASEQFSTNLFPSLQTNVIAAVGQSRYEYGYTGLASLELAILHDFETAPAGTFIDPSTMPRGLLTPGFSTTPTATTALTVTPTARQRICWTQPVSLFSNYGNSLWVGPTVPGSEGPEPVSDHNSSPLPSDFCL